MQFCFILISSPTLLGFADIPVLTKVFSLSLTHGRARTHNNFETNVFLKIVSLDLFPFIRSALFPWPGCRKSGCTGGEKYSRDRMGDRKER